MNQSKKDVFAHLKTIADSVSISSGPQGNNVCFVNKANQPEYTKDGFTILKRQSNPNPLWNVAYRALLDAATNTVREVGDNTTLTVTLTNAVAQEGLNAINSKAVRPADLKRQLEEAHKFAENFILNFSTPVRTQSQIEAVATLSANNNEQIGTAVSTALAKCGPDSTILLDQRFSNTVKVFFEHQEGLEIPNGLVHSAFVKDQQSQSTSLENPLIMCVPYHMSDLTQIQEKLSKLLTEISDTGRPLILAVSAITDAALNFFIQVARKNMIKGGIAVITLPTNDEVITDLTSYFNHKFLDEASLPRNIALYMKDYEMKDLGQSNGITTMSAGSTIFGSPIDRTELNKRVEELKGKLSKNSSDANLKKRISQLTVGLGTIVIEARTESEQAEIRDLVDDAVLASRSAVKYGVLPGGGVLLLRAAQLLLANNANKPNFGEQVLAKALEKPFKVLCDNAVLDFNHISSPILDSLNPNFGFDFRKEDYVDLVEYGIIEPTKGPIAAMRNAIAVANQLLSTAEFQFPITEKKL